MSEKMEFVFKYETVEYVSAEGKTGRYAEIIGFEGEAEVINVPESIDGFEVKSIGRKAFKDCGFITAVTLPDTVRDIGYDAFSGCFALRKVKLPAKVEYIGNRAFMGCALRSVKLSPEVGIIGRKAFGCGADGEKIADFRIYCGKYSTAFKYASDYGFVCITEDTNSSSFMYTVEEVDSGEGAELAACLTCYCGSKKSVTVPSELGGFPVKVIDCGAFAQTDVVNVTLPECTEKILSGAFRGCKSLKSVTLPKAQTYIADYAFFGCGSVRFKAERVG